MCIYIYIYIYIYITHVYVYQSGAGVGREQTRAALFSSDVRGTTRSELLIGTMGRKGLCPRQEDYAKNANWSTG